MKIVVNLTASLEFTAQIRLAFHLSTLCFTKFGISLLCALYFSSCVLSGDKGLASPFGIDSISLVSIAKRIEAEIIQKQMKPKVHMP